MQTLTELMGEIIIYRINIDRIQGRNTQFYIKIEEFNILLSIMDRTTPWKGSRELQFNGNKISSGDGEIFLQMHSGDGYAIL